MARRKEEEKCKPIKFSKASKLPKRYNVMLHNVFFFNLTHMCRKYMKKMPSSCMYPGNRFFLFPMHACVCVYTHARAFVLLSLYAYVSLRFMSRTSSIILTPYLLRHGLY